MDPCPAQLIVERRGRQVWFVPRWKLGRTGHTACPCVILLISGRVTLLWVYEPCWRGKGFRRTVQDCTFSLVYLFWMYYIQSLSSWQKTFGFWGSVESYYEVAKKPLDIKKKKFYVPVTPKHWLLEKGVTYLIIVIEQCSYRWNSTVPQGPQGFGFHI